MRRNKRKEFTKELKGQLWEEMTLNYFKEGMVAVNHIKKQRETMVDYLNMAQTDFVQFLERQDEKQQVVQDFIDNFN